MRSELQFFMIQADEEEFVSLFTNFVDRIDKESEWQWFFYVCDCPIQFLRSKKVDNQLLSGRISIATHGFGLQYEAAKSAEQLYSKMRRWVKKYYSNNLTVENVKSKNSKMNTSRFWVSKRVVTLKKTDKQLILRQIPNAPIVFEILD
ncbi:hypothetical protein [Aquimarina sp. SS2-1]|uniref:hypothetical protein n=1 Tax=Aquimarina besae TaxID=3342247 RepID=UPI00366D50D3